ncbi:GNAT family N-acetyltransferase [Photobacterium galatheae]|uniref:N-acetyltransferase domain-containing protein n=1 Tax=Photobacterium galatheae TaxID=1654360 RepID=A0A066RMQ0_9GAMM|nr:GNAT family N-acetyltransferase [Photobacterium galatheae]KDM91624.1 hypothetical protein EA58_11425 [Photobacterium galatheae]MCM0149698.1 GNAT family N-acetyltransferase [Photobacterium galatheae]
MIRIEQYTEYRKAEVCSLLVNPEQTEFTIGKMPEVLADLQAHEHACLITINHQVAGSFILDTRYAETYRFCPEDALGVRALLIDKAFQGQGIASQGIRALPAFVQRHYPDVQALYLTVNCHNLPAYQCYLKTGFQDTGDLYYGGPAGPQHILFKHLSGEHACSPE